MQRATYQCLSKTGLLSNREEERKKVKMKFTERRTPKIRCRQRQVLRRFYER